MKKLHEALKAKREAGELEFLDPIQKVKKNPKSLRAAINGKCYECEGEDADPAFRWRIGNCAVGIGCPLYGLRPYQNQLGKPTPRSLRVSIDDMA